MKNLKFLLLIVALFVATAGMAKEMWEVQFTTSPEGKLSDHAKLIKSILKENCKGFDKVEIKEKSKTLIITFDYERTTPQEMLNLLNEKLPTLKATMTESVQPMSLDLQKAQDKFSDAKKNRQKVVDKLKEACDDYDKAYEELENQLNKATKRGYVQQSEVVRTKITISED